MKLTPISDHPDAARILYQLLEERPAYANISHRGMPTWEEHLAFIGQKPGPWGSGRDHPYAAWYIIVAEHGSAVGAVYLTHANEIGVSIFHQFQGRGYGNDAVVILMMEHGERRYLANIAPTNEPSRKMFEKLGFRTIQHTLALDAD